MSVAAPELPDLVGRQEPVISLVPSCTSSSGPEVVELARKAGLVLDPWQELVLRDALGERGDGKWAAFEAAVIVGRQNGKSAIFEARMLAGLFLFDEELIIYSAHEFKTAQEIFRRMEELISGTAAFRRRVKAVSRSKGDEGIELTTRQRLRFVARSTGSGRGFSGDCNIWDECQILGEAPVDALMPTMSARPNPQLWYGGSAPDADLAPCDQIARVRRRALEGADRLAYFEWSAQVCGADCREGCEAHDDPGDPVVWAKTNPGLGIRLSVEQTAREFESMSARGFARERLSVGNWPTETDAEWPVIPEAVWRALADPTSKRVGPVGFAIDATPNATHAAIGVAGTRADGLGHVELVEHRRGTGWVVDRAVALQAKWEPVAFVVDPGGPAGFLIPKLEAAGIEVTKTSARDVASATESMISAAGVVDGDEATVRVRPHPALDAAVAGAETVPLADARKWSRRSVAVDISPLVAVTLARWGLATCEADQAPEPFAIWG